MQKLVFKCPINNVSFGNVSLNLLREMYAREMVVAHFPIGQVDVGVYDKLTPDFKNWLSNCTANRFNLVSKDIPTLQLWHLNGSENRITPRQYLLSFYELNKPTQPEINLASLQDHVFFSSSHAAETFKFAGCDNVSAVPLGFDPDFGPTGKEYLKDKVHFGLMGKFEKRKHTAEILKLWANKYGNNYDYQLSCCINNPFMDPQQVNATIGAALGGKQYGNINFLPFLRTNSEVNDFLNAIDIDLTGLSGAEGWNLPAFNATALGKWSIVLNASSHKDWATDDNSILIEPSGTTSAVDGFFFKENDPFNQGEISLFNPEEVLSKMEYAESVCKKTNTEGLKLQKDFTYSRTLDSILSKLT